MRSRRIVPVCVALMVAMATACGTGGPQAPSTPSVPSAAPEDEANPASSEATEEAQKTIEFCGEAHPADAHRISCHDHISDLSPLREATGLKFLDISRTKVTDLSPISGLSKLVELNLSGSSVSDLSPISGLTSLEKLNIDGTRVEDLSPVVGLNNLVKLSLEDTPVSDYRPLLHLGLGIELCAIADTEDYCDKKRPGRPSDQSIATVFARATRAVVVTTYLGRQHMMNERDLGNVSEAQLDGATEFPHRTVMCEVEDVEELSSLEKALAVKGNQRWSHYPHLYFGNPRVELFAAEEHLGTFVLNGDVNGMRLLLEGKQLEQLQVWNGDAELKKPKRIRDWIRRCEKAH